MRQITLKKGNYLILEDSRSTLDEFYIVETGQVVVDTKEPHFEQMVDSEDYYFEFQSKQRELTPGCFFGLMSPILGYRRFESVWAKDDSNILCVHKNGITTFIQQYKQYTRYILTELFERLKSYNHFFTSQDHAIQDQQTLYVIANHFHQKGQMPQALYAYETLIRENPESTYASLAREQVAKEKKIKRYLRPTDFVKNQPKRYQKNNMTFYEYISGQIIFCETEIGNQLYLIKSGEVLITKINSDGASTLDILGKGEIFGEMAVLNEKNTKTSHHTTNKRSATAIARTDATLVAVSREKIKKIFELKNFHVFAEKLLKTLLRRIWHTKVVLISRSLNDPLDKITAILYSEIFKNTNTVELKKNTQKEKPFEFDFGIHGLLERMGPEINITKEPVLPERFSLDDFLKRSLLKTGYGASIMKSKKMFTFSDNHIVCESPKEIIHAWEKVKKKGF